MELKIITMQQVYHAGIRELCVASEITMKKHTYQRQIRL